MKTAEASGSRAGSTFLMVFLLLAAGIVATGTFYYRHYRRNYRAEVERQLSAIADLKMSELVQWRTERLADGAVFFRNPSFTALVRRSFEKPADEDAQRQLLDWLGKYATNKGYDQVCLLDAQGVSRLSLPAGLTPADSAIVQGESEVLRSGRVTFQDFFRGEQDPRIFLAVLVPILDERDASRPLGVLVLRVDPEAHLYPSIKRWPTPSPTAETLLVRREGNEVVFLNELRFRTKTTLNLRVSLDDTRLPAVQAAMGQEGVVDGIDYRGVPVVAALRAIPDSPWAMVARMDASEVYGPLHERLWQVIVMIGALLLSAGACVDRVWRQQRNRFYRERAAASEAIRQTKGYLENLIDHANAPIIVWDPQFHVTRFNHAFETLTGRRAGDVVGGPLEVVFPSALVEGSLKLIKKTLERERWDAVEIAITHLDGSVHTVLWSSATIFTAGGKAPVAGIAQGQDITERKRIEEELIDSREQLRALANRLQFAREQECGRIAREIHDEMGQTLTGLKMDLRWIENRLDDFGADPRANQLLDRVVAATELADDAMKAVQRISAELRPGVLDRLGLMLALGYEVNRFQMRTSVPCRLAAPAEEPFLPPDAATAFFRILQEALTNVARHARAGKVDVTFESSDNKWVLEVRDDGKGIQEDDLADPASLGLLGMHERAATLGGEVVIRPGPGGGTIVTACIPKSPAHEVNG